MEDNNCFGKNQNYDDINLHHYIISYDPMDAADNALTPERAQALGMEYAKKYFPGYQALVCIHTDGHNSSGNIHTHIVINSVRKFDVEHAEFMERYAIPMLGSSTTEPKNTWHSSSSLSPP